MSSRYKAMTLAVLNTAGQHLPILENWDPSATYVQNNVGYEIHIAETDKRTPIIVGWTAFL